MKTILKKSGCRIFVCMMFIIPSFSLPSFGEENNAPLWNVNILNSSFQINTIADGCGPAENEVCVSCHDLVENAPKPDFKRISEPTHGVGMYRLSASEYLSINMHTYSDYLKPRCIACHFNPKVSKKNPIMEKLKAKFFAQRDSVREYKKRLRLN